MKIKDEYLSNLESILTQYGFRKIEDTGDEEDETQALGADYVFEIGHSRRGQFYYILVFEGTGDIYLFTSRADGDGAMIDAPDVILKMFTDGIIETG